MATAPSGLGMIKERNEKPAKEEGKAKDYKVKFKPPATLAPPEDKEAGDTFDATVQLRLEKDGQYCILKIDGVPLTEGDEEETETVVEETETTAPTLEGAVAAHRDGGYQF